MTASTIPNLLEEYRQFQTLRPVFIGGLRRSGTTLLQRMLDGHPQLLVYSLEDCIIRSSFFENKQFSLCEIHKLLHARDAKNVLSYMMSNPKLALALESRIETRDESLAKRHLHLGPNKILVNDVDRDLFEEVFLKVFHANTRQWDVGDALKVWMFSFFYASGVTRMSDYVGWVTKCPDEGRCFRFYVTFLPDCRVLNLIRDPRGFYASEKARICPDKQGFSRHQIGKAVELWRSAVVNQREAIRLAHDNLMCIRYEDLVKHAGRTMETVAKFIGIDFSDSLVKPTFRGQPWNANSSFQIDESTKGALLVHVSDRWKHTLGWRERRLLEELLAEEMVAFRYRGRVLGFYNRVEKYIVHLIKPFIKGLRLLYRLPSNRW